MSLTTKALKRLGVAGVAAITIGAGLPALVAAPASAQTAPNGTTTQLRIEPQNQQGAAGTCLIYTVTPQNNTGGTPTDTQGQEILLQATPTGTNQISFCDPDPNFPNNSTSFNPDDNNANTTFTTGTTSTRTAFGTADNDQQSNTGTQRFGIRSDSPGGATIRAFVDTTGVNLNNNNQFDAGEPTGTATATFTAGGNNPSDTTSGGNAAQDAVATITEIAQNVNANPVVAGQGTQFVTVQLRNASGDPVSGVVVSAVFGSGSANGAQTSPQANAQQIQCVGGGTRLDANGNTVTGQSPETTTTGSQGGPVSNNNGIATCFFQAVRAGTDTITVFVNQTDGNTTGFDQGAEPSLTVTRTTQAAPNQNVAQARFIDLTPEGPTTTVSGTDRTFTATVTDATGAAVQGVNVDFLIQGTVGTFANGATTTTGNTNALGQVNVVVRSVTGQTGQATVTASIRADQTGVGGTPAAGANETQCDEPVNSPTTGNAAGNCSDAEVTNFSPTSPSPTATATGTTSPSPTATATGTQSPRPTATATAPTQQLTLRVTGPATITPGQQSIMRGTGQANAVVILRCYSRPSTQYFDARRVPLGENGEVEFRLSPGTNTRCFLKYADTADNDARNSQSVVQNVATALSLSVVRNGTRNYTFQGRILPRRAGQLITLYRVQSNGSRILTSQLRTDATGTYRINRRFTGSGTFGFLTRTGQTLTNAAGESNTRDQNTGRGNARPTAIF